MKSNSIAKERILVMGGFKAGKTTAWCDIASWYKRTETPGKFYVMDTDMTVERSLEAYEGVGDIIVSDDIQSWPEFKLAAAKFRQLGTQDDWLIVDSIDFAWEAVQDWYVEQAFGESSDAFFLDFKRQGKDGHPLADGFGMNWNVIKKQYQPVLANIRRFPGHVLVCTPAESTAQEKDANVQRVFGKYGVKPKGEKRLGFNFHSLLLMLNNAKDDYRITTVGDRSRKELVNEKVNSFTMTYLKGVAGWEVP